MKRQLSGFEVDSTPRIKLIFVCAQRVDVRWFVLNDSFNALNAEVSNMLPVEGVVCYFIHLFIYSYVFIYNYRTVFPCHVGCIEEQSVWRIHQDMYQPDVGISSAL